MRLKSYLFIFLLVLVCFSFVEAQENYTRNDVLDKMNKSVLIIEDMAEENFSIFYVNDTLFEAKNLLQIVDYAEIIRGNVNATSFEESNARKELRLVSWQDLTYNDVFEKLEIIESRRMEAIFIYDEFVIEQSRIDYGLEVKNETLVVFEEARKSFYEDRYNESLALLEEYRVLLEEESVENSLIYGIRDGTKNFFLKYWFYLLIILFLLIILVYIVYKILEVKFLRKKVHNLKIERKVLNDLIKKTQRDRFQTSKISELIYKIRMNKFKERITFIDENLPVLKKRLEKISPSRGFNRSVRKIKKVKGNKKVVKKILRKKI